MKQKRKSYLRQRIITGLMVLSIAFIAFLTYRDILGYFFTDTDTLTAIDTSRIQSFLDVGRIFTEPLMSGTTLVEIVKGYGPIAALSYSLDYSLWGLNPFGYHLTDLILHILVSVLVFFLIRSLTNGNQAIAWLSAIIFTTHPILVEVVPGISRRRDILAALFLLLSLLLFLKQFSQSSRNRSYLLLSICFYALALGAKEIAIILPFLIFTYLMASSLSDETENKLFRAVKGSVPYFIATLVVLAWRTYILQGIGGYVDASLGERTFGAISHIWRIITSYFVNLVYPTDFLSAIPNFSPRTLSLIGLFALFIFLLSYRRTLFSIVGHKGGRAKRALRALFLALVLLSFIGVLAYPLVSPYINQLLQQAYYGKGLKFLTDAMGGRDFTPLENYFYIARDLILMSFSLSLVFSVIGLYCSLGMDRRQKVVNFFKSSAHGRSVVFLLVWLSLPLGIYLAHTVFFRRYLYISIIPFSAMLSIMLVESFQFIIQRIRRDRQPSTSSYRLPFISSAAAPFVIAAGLLISLLAYSPLVRTYGEWEDSGNISSIILHGLSGFLAKLPNDAVLHVYNLPSGISSYEAEIPHAKEVAYLADFSIKSWLDLNHPTNQMEVIVHNRSKLALWPAELNLTWEKGDARNVMIMIRYDSK